MQVIWTLLTFSLTWKNDLIVSMKWGLLLNFSLTMLKKKKKTYDDEILKFTKEICSVSKCLFSTCLSVT